MYGLIGKSLVHSFSADFFNEKFRREKIPQSYRLFPLEDIASLPSLIQTHPDIEGLNVTIPYKEEVIAYLDSISPEAREIGAVNVIKIEDRSSGPKSGVKKFLTGYNTDYIGFRDSLVPLLRPDVTKALILGTGGASKAVAYALKELGLESVKVSRNPSVGQLSYDCLDSRIIRDHLLIVNTTPLGTFPDTGEAPRLPYRDISPLHICYDLVYNPAVTEFLKLCAAEGAVTKNGMEMLRRQAIAAWHIWQTMD